MADGLAGLSPGHTQIDFAIAGEAVFQIIVFHWFAPCLLMRSP
jgi:hypothetical protein